MRQQVKNFCIRGALFAWGGPAILAIVWLGLQGGGILETLTVREAVLGILSTTVMAFIAAGVSIVYQLERLPMASAALIHALVLYADYLGFYLLNGWIPLNKVWMFTLIFLAGFLVIWVATYIPTRIKVAKLNKNLNPPT